MTPEQFCYWLQGFAEIKGGCEGPTAQEWKVIKDHLELVFKKETPTYVNPVHGPKEVQQAGPQINPSRWDNPGPLITC